MDIFRDKTAIVTGGASGIGKGLCEELGKYGAVVVVADLNGEEARNVAASLKASGGRAEAVKLDVTNEGDVRGLINETAAKRGKLDYIFNNAGIGIGGVDNLGNVHADQFWNQYTFGNVKERKFGDIWTDTSNPLMKGLKNRSSLIKGRCSKCKYFSLCNGNFRARAEAVYGDVWESDPACYLSDKEIGIA